MFFEEKDASQYTLTMKVFHQLKNDILQGKYKIGANLVETKLARELGVSRTPVREAIRLLEFEGLVTNIPNRGAVVDGISPNDIDDIYAIRTLIEGLAAKWAVEKMTESELKNLEETMDLMEFYTSKGDMEAVAKLDTKFHDIIYRSCKSKPLWQVLMNFHDLAQSFRTNSITVKGRVQKTLAEHRQIVQAFRLRNAEAAEKAITAHVVGVMENMSSMHETDEY